MSIVRPIPVTLLAVLALVGLLPVTAPTAKADVSDTISVVKEGEELANAEIVARLAEATFDEPTDRVLIGREDEFADSVASAVMQGDAPLLLVPTDGPVSQRVLDLLELYDPDEVVLLGGEAALSNDVEDELAGDYDVVRRAGATRFETAIDIALNEAPTADTAIIARGFAAGDADDETQAFADALAAGGWAADEGWPILLTQTEALNSNLRSYLTESQITQVMLMGGTAAISQEVEEELEAMDVTTTRIAGPDRFTTAVEVAKERGVDNATDAGRIVLVEGQADNAWAAGFAAAAHSAVFDAPVVLANGEGLPSSTTDFLTPPSAFAQTGFFDEAVLTCATLPSTCEEARQVRGLPAQLTVAFNPEPGSEVEGGNVVQVTYSGDSGGPVTLSAPCIGSVNGHAPGTVSAIVSSSFTGECEVTATVTLGDGSTQSDTATYTIIEPDVTVTSGILTVPLSNGYQWVPGAFELSTTLGDNDTYEVDGVGSDRATFLANATRGDLVAQATQPGVPVHHALANRAPEHYTSGTVGDVDLLGGTAAIIEPVSGWALRTFPLQAGSVQVDSMSSDHPTLHNDISEGDRVSLSTNPDMTLALISLTNDSISGPVTAANVTAGTLLFQIASGGLPGSPLIGDVPDGPSNTQFLIDERDTDVQLFIGGQQTSYAAFRENLNNGDTLTYSRIGGIEQFRLVNDATLPPPSLATETFDFAQRTLVLLGQFGRDGRTFAMNATFTVDGNPADLAQFQAAYTAGDQVTIVPTDGTTPEQVRLVNQNLTGDVSSFDTSSQVYSVSNANGTIYVALPYTGNPFGTSPSNTYAVNGSPTTQDGFESALDGASTPTITVVPGNGPNVPNSHQLQTL